MAGEIYLVQDDDQLIPMSEKAYDFEVELQKLLAQYPRLLAGDQMNEENPRRWLLISREVGIPWEEGGPNQFSLDHLFLDQDGIPTLVEVKRSTDNRLRREVVGQMLDYAANAVSYWPAEAIRAKFEAICEVQGLDPDELVAEFLRADLGDDDDVEDYWHKVKTNLQANRIRLVFVADEIPPQLRRIVEFLNGEMHRVEVLAVEVKQYAGEGLKTLVPRVLGQLAKPKDGDGPEPRQWDEPSFFEELERRGGSEQASAARTILEWARFRGTQIWWGRGKRTGSFVPCFSHRGRDYYLFAVRTNGILTVYFQSYQTKPPFEPAEKRMELLERLNRIAGLSISEDAIARKPSISLEVLTGKQAIDSLLGAFDWVIKEIRGA